MLKYRVIYINYILKTENMKKLNASLLRSVEAKKMFALTCMLFIVGFFNNNMGT